MPISHTRDLTRPLKTSETLARKLVEMLLAEGLSRGDSLPTEASMLEEYSVSRESLREGLRLLEVQGLLTIRRGPRKSLDHIDRLSLLVIANMSRAPAPGSGVGAVVMPQVA